MQGRGRGTHEVVRHRVWRMTHERGGAGKRCERCKPAISRRFASRTLRPGSGRTVPVQPVRLRFSVARPGPPNPSSDQALQGPSITSSDFESRTDARMRQARRAESRSARLQARPGPSGAGLSRPRVRTPRAVSWRERCGRASQGATRPRPDPPGQDRGCRVGGLKTSSSPEVPLPEAEDAAGLREARDT